MGRLSHVFPSLTSNVVPGPSKNAFPAQGTSSVRYEVKSTMRTGVFWRNAMGLMVSEPAAISMVADEYIYITIEYEFDAGVKIDARELLSEKINDNNHAEYQGVVKALSELERNPTWANHRRFSYTVGISREALDAVGGVAYLNDVDLIVGFERHRESLNPYSAPGQRQQVSELLSNEDGCTQRYMLIDNSSIYGPRWINTGVHVFELKPLQIPHLDDGVYLTTQNGRDEDATTRFYSYADAEKALGLYRHRVEAETYGSPEARFKADLKEAEQELAREKVEMARDRQSMERDKQEMEADRHRREEEIKNDDLRRKREREEIDARKQRHKEEVDRQRERMDMERERIEFERKTYSERQKFEYDQVSHTRKDQTDTVKSAIEISKLLLSMLGVGLSIAALVAKKSK